MQKLCNRLIWYSLLAILLFIPFQGLITSWLPGLTGISRLSIALWKDVLLIFVSLLAAIKLVYNPNYIGKLLANKLNWVLIAFIMLNLISLVFFSPELNAGAYGTLINIRSPMLLIIIQILLLNNNKPEYYQKVVSLFTLIPYIIVSGFGVLQTFILPKDWLRHFGYARSEVGNGLNTIAPYYTIDGQSDVIRINSFLRGPNPLGAYLVLPLVCIIAKLKRHSIFVLLLVAGLVTLYSSHSRSGWVGFAVAVASYIALSIPKRMQKYLMSTVLLGIITLLILVMGFKSSSFVQNYILHDNPNIGPVATSNSGHIDQAKQAISHIVDHPLTGCGVGCSGPASFHLTSHPVNLSENSYLQIGVELGVIGLVLYLLIFILVTKRLFNNRHNQFALIALCTLVGLSISALFLHVWQEETLAYTAWIWVGFALINNPD